MRKILGIGNALVDILINIDSDDFLKDFALPKASMQLVDKTLSAKIMASFKGKKIQLSSGGSSANTIHGLASLNIPTGFLGKVGNDEMGMFFSEDMKKNKIQATLLKGKEETGKAITLISPNKERTFATYLGSAVEMTANDISDDLFTDVDILHIEGYLVQNQDLIRHAMETAKKMGCKVSLDLASYNIVEAHLEFLQTITKEYVDILFANEDEAKSFTSDPPEKALQKIASMVEIAIVKIGAKGSMIQKGTTQEMIQPNKTDKLDTTGAGDLYASGFLYGLVHDLPLQKAGEIGSLLASSVIEDIGAKIKPEKWPIIQKKITSIIKK